MPSHDDKLSGAAETYNTGEHADYAAQSADGKESSLLQKGWDNLSPLLIGHPLLWPFIYGSSYLNGKTPKDTVIDAAGSIASRLGGPCRGPLNWNAQGRDVVAVALCPVCRLAFAATDGGETACALLTNIASPLIVFTTTNQVSGSRIASLAAVLVFETWVNQKVVQEQLFGIPQRCV